MSGPLIRWSGLGSISVISIRFTIPLFLAYAWIKWVEKRSLGKINKSLAWVSVLTALGNVFYISAISLTSISNVLLLLYTRPAMATIFASLFLRERVDLSRWLLLLLSFGGAILVVSSHQLGFENKDITGMLLALAAALVVAFSWALVKRNGYQGRSTGEVIFFQHLFGAALTFPLLLSTISEQNFMSIGICLIYAVVIGFVATLLYFLGLKHVPLSKAMPLTYAELVVALIIGIFFFDEILSPQSIIGGIFIVLSSAGTIKLNRESAS
jgi:drug/metabolite transporter (DMT)-like permease